jgi:hypothetical protein
VQQVAIVLLKGKEIIELEKEVVLLQRYFVSVAHNLL